MFHNRQLKPTFEHIELPAKLLDYFLPSNQSNINQKCETIQRLVSIMNSCDKTGSVARLKTPVFSGHGRILSRRDHASLVDQVGPDNNGSEISVMESTGLDRTQTCGELSLMPRTSPEGAKLGGTTCGSTHVAIDMPLQNNAGSLPLASRRNLPAEIISQCKQCEEIFTININEQQFFVPKAMSKMSMSTPAQCAQC